MCLSPRPSSNLTRTFQTRLPSACLLSARPLVVWPASIVLSWAWPLLTNLFLGPFWVVSPVCQSTSRMPQSGLATYRYAISRGDVKAEMGAETVHGHPQSRGWCSSAAPRLCSQPATSVPLEDIPPTTWFLVCSAECEICLRR